MHCPVCGFIEDCSREERAGGSGGGVDSFMMGQMKTKKLTTGIDGSDFSRRQLFWLKLYCYRPFQPRSAATGWVTLCLLLLCRNTVHSGGIIYYLVSRQEG